ncbi:MAG TPA: sodium-dependent transporter [Methylomirabilota bacterium]|nr:sodium-dependent transporter [Methylomirabilota bacterium]
MGAPAGRGQWSSQLGFVLAAAGSAIGLGNIWRFPYSAGENGGGAFLLVYLVCVVCLGLPVMLLEISLGRATAKNPVGAIRAIRPRGPWKGLGYLAIVTGVGILSFYAVIAGQVLATFVDFSQRVVTGDVLFASYGAGASVGFFALFLLLTLLVVVGGVQRGIERWAKILMPLLLVLMVVIIVRGLLLPGAGEGLRWLFMPDFGKLDLQVVLDAMAQAFFSLSLGMGAMLTYGSYLSKRQDILHCGSWVVFFDTLIAILAGLMIFPALFALGQQPDAGPALIFNVLPAVFEVMAGGVVIGAVFFCLLSVAALTSTVSLLEVVSAYFIDELGWSRRRTVWTAAAITLLVGVPAALAWVGTSPWATVSLLGLEGVFSLMDFAFVNVSLPLGAVLLCLFGVFVWGLGPASQEIQSSSRSFAAVAPIWRFFVRFICPLFIAIILITQFLSL